MEALSEMMDLSLSLHWTLEQSLPAAILEINTLKHIHPKSGVILPDVVIPLTVLHGLQTSMLKRPIEELPVVAASAFMRKIEEEGEQEWSRVVFPFTIDVYLGGNDPNDLTTIALKWAVLLDKWVERSANDILPGFWSPEGGDIDVSYTLEKRGNEYRQLVSVTSVLLTVE